MAQKKAVAKPKKAANGVQKKQGNEQLNKSLKSKLTEDAALAAAIAVKPQQKKGAGKVPVKAAPPPKPVNDEESDDEDDDDEDDDDVVQEHGNGMEIQEDESDEEDADDNDDDDDDEEDDDDKLIDNEAVESEDEDDSESETKPGEVVSAAEQETNNDEDDDDDDDAPEEAPIKKQSIKDQSIFKTKIKMGLPPADTPEDHVIVVSNLPEKYNRQQLLDLFLKFGQILVTSFVKGQRGSLVFVYDKAASAKAAVAAKGIQFQGQNLNVLLGKPENKNDRTVRLSCLNPNVTEEELRKLFANCGVIEEIRQIHKLGGAFVSFLSKESAAAALKLTNSKVGDRIVQISALDNKIEKDPEHTIVLSNTGELESYSSDVLAKIFKKFGEVIHIEVICKKLTLAFVTFKSDDAVEKALELDGKTINDLSLKLERYKSSRSHHTILVTNLSFDADKEEVEGIFSKAGEIENLHITPGRAFVTYKSTEGFCKSFMLNETEIRGKPVFLVPYSKLRNKIMGPKLDHQNNKPHFGNGPPSQYQRKFNGPKGNFKQNRPGPGPKRPAQGQKFKAPFNNKRPKMSAI